MKRTYETSANLAPEVKQRVQKELDLGFLNLSEGFFPQAEMNFILALKFDSTCPDAFWGLCLVKLKLENEDFLYSNPVQNKQVLQLEECQKALQFAGENLKKKYEDLLERINKIKEGESY